MLVSVSLHRVDMPLNHEYSAVGCQLILGVWRMCHHLSSCVREGRGSQAFVTAAVDPTASGDPMRAAWHIPHESPEADG